MKKVLALLMAISFTISPAFAKAGSSGGSSRSSGSFTSKSSSYGTTSSGSASRQTSFSGSTKPAIPTTTSSTTTSSRPATTTSTTASTPTSTTSSSTYPAGSTTIINNDRDRDSGPGIGSTILGTAAGAAIGTVVGNSISGNHGAVAQPVQTYAQPAPGQYSNQIAVQPSGSYTTSTSSVNSGFSFLLFLIKTIFYGLLLGGLFYLGRKLYYWYKGRKLQTSPIDAQVHIPVFKQQVALLQLSCAKTDADSQKALARITTPEMFVYLSNLASENEERNSINVIKDVNVGTTTIRSIETVDDKLYASVKMSVTMLDYWTDLEGNLLSDPGSDTTPTRTTDVYTFVSTNGGKTWLISAIEEYETREME